MEETKRRHRWFQFTLRESLLVLTLAATIGGWYVDHRHTKVLAPLLTHLDGTIATHGVHGEAWVSRPPLFIPGLPFAQVLSAERIERVFARHENWFGLGAVYSTALVVWSFLGQVLRDGEEASCQAAVARVIVHQQQVGDTAPTSDTGDYCRARAKLSEGALRELAIEVADELESQAPRAWLWKGRHAKLVDGFTFTLPDTPSNQAAYPQHTAQKPGVGLPIARCCAILSLAPTSLLDLKLGPYSGKESGEPALLRALLDSFSPDDILVVDRYYCSFLLIGMLLTRRRLVR